MKRRSIVALCLVAVAARRSSPRRRARPRRRLPARITVWLQVDAQSGWPDLVAAANQQFQSDHPGTTVNIQYQNWGDHLQKFDATLAGGGGPDVIEMGNTEMTKYMAAGAFADLEPSKSRSTTRRTGSRASPRPACTAARPTACPTTPARASSPTAPTSSRRPGSRSFRTRRPQYAADAKKLLAKNPKKGFSPVYIAGTDWYVAMGFVFDYGGGIAQQVSGKWKGLLSSPQVDRRPDRVQELLPRDVAGQQDDRRGAPEPVRRVRTGPGRVDDRPELVQLLRRQEVHASDRRSS